MLERIRFLVLISVILTWPLTGSAAGPAVKCSDNPAACGCTGCGWLNLDCNYKQTCQPTLGGIAWECQLSDSCKTPDQITKEKECEDANTVMILGTNTVDEAACKQVKGCYINRDFKKCTICPTDCSGYTDVLDCKKEGDPCGLAPCQQFNDGSCMSGSVDTGKSGALPSTVKLTCRCQCQDITICGFGVGSQADPERLEIQCQNQCARTCGGIAVYSGSCGSKCETYCADEYSAPEKYLSRAECAISCRSACDFRKLIQDMIDMIYLVSGIIGVVMIIIHSIRIAIASDPGSREDAKKSIIFVLVALAVIALAGTLVPLFSGIAGNASKPIECGGGSSGVQGPANAAQVVTAPGCQEACDRVQSRLKGVCVQTSPTTESCASLSPGPADTSSAADACKAASPDNAKCCCNM